VLRGQANLGVAVLFSSHQLELVEQLCDRVGIIQRGRMIASGTVDELRQGGPRRYWVDPPGASDGWMAKVPGATLVQTSGSRTLIQLADGTDDQALLSAALTTGPVHEFRRDVPSLAELYRHVVGDKASPSRD